MSLQAKTSRPAVSDGLFAVYLFSAFRITGRYKALNICSSEFFRNGSICSSGSKRKILCTGLAPDHR
jgi:hypothetical protein